MRLLLLLIAVLAVGIIIARLRSRAALSSASENARPTVGSAEADAQTLRALRDAGADLTKATEVNFYLYFPTREAAERAAASAGTPVLTASVGPGALGSNWLCYVTGTIVPSESTIRAASTRLAALAASLDGEYDGWEAAVAK